MTPDCPIPSVDGECYRQIGAPLEDRPVGAVDARSARCAMVGEYRGDDVASAKASEEG